MSDQSVCQQQTPEQTQDSVNDDLLPSLNDVIAFFTGGSSSGQGSAMGSQNTLGNAGVQAMLFGGSNSPRTHVVVKGETLGTIAAKYTGDPKRYKELWEANKDKVPNPNVVSAGQVLKLPDAWSAASSSGECVDEPTKTTENADNSTGLGDLWNDASETLGASMDTMSGVIQDGMDWASNKAEEVWSWIEGSTSSAAQSVGIGEDSALGDQGAASGQSTTPANTTGATPADKSGANVTGWMVVTDGKAIVRQGGDFLAVQPQRILPKGSRVRVIGTSQMGGTTYAQIETEATAADPITEANNLWTSLSNLMAGGKDHALGNEKQGGDEKVSADGIRGALPEGRTPGKSPYGWRYGSAFKTSLDGINLRGSLLDKVVRMVEWAIANDMVTANIEFVSGMRSPAQAHQMSVAWHIQYGTNVTLDALKALTDGKDSDGNRWYKEGWTMEQVKANAHNVRASSAIAAAGYPKGDPRRKPLNDNQGVSRHCSGGAIDVTIPWRAKGKNASTNSTDVWGWEEIYKMFGLHRPLGPSSKHPEHWHIEETSKVLDAEEDAEP